MQKKLSIIIPAYNEERTIHLILDRIKAVNLINDIQKEIIITNDCSSDDTEGAITRYAQSNPELGIRYLRRHHAGMVELADTRDLKSLGT